MDDQQEHEFEEASQRAEAEREGGHEALAEIADYEARLRAFRPCADCSTEIGCFEADEPRCPYGQW